MTLLSLRYSGSVLVCVVWSKLAFFFTFCVFWCVLSDQNWPSFSPSVCFGVCCLIKSGLFHLLCVLMCIVWSKLASFFLSFFYHLCVLKCVIWSQLAFFFTFCVLCVVWSELAFFTFCVFWCVLSDQNWSFSPSVCFDMCCLIKISLLFHLLCVLMCVVWSKLAFFFTFCAFWSVLSDQSELAFFLFLFSFLFFTFCGFCCLIKISPFLTFYIKT